MQLIYRAIAFARKDLVQAFAKISYSNPKHHFPALLQQDDCLGWSSQGTECPLRYRRVKAHDSPLDSLNENRVGFQAESLLGASKLAGLG